MTAPGPSAPSNVRLYSDPAALPQRVFLDASVVLDLYEHQLATSGTGAPGRGPVTGPGGRGPRKHGLLANFLDRLKAAGAEVLVTPFVLEEVFHVLLGRALGKGVDEKAFRRAKPVEHAALRKKAVAMFKQAVMGCARKDVKIVMPALPIDGRTLHDKFVQLVSDVPQIGGRDALHILTGGLLECKTFASADGDFRFVTTIVVYMPVMPSAA